MKPIIIQHLIKQLKKKTPNTIVEDAPSKDHSTSATVFVLLLVVMILVVALK